MNWLTFPLIQKYTTNSPVWLTASTCFFHDETRVTWNPPWLANLNDISDPMAPPPITAIFIRFLLICDVTERQVWNSSSKVLLMSWPTGEAALVGELSSVPMSLRYCSYSLFRIVNECCFAGNSPLSTWKRNL